MSETPTLQAFDPSEFDPSLNDNAKFFSTMLFRWLTKHERYYRIYESNWSRPLGYKVDYPVLYIGLIQDGCLHGSHLRSICQHGAELKAWAHCDGEMEIDSFKDITEDFYDLYRKTGMCAIHGDNWHNWDTYSETRVCRRCKKVEYSMITMVPKVTWVDERKDATNESDIT